MQRAGGITCNRNSDPGWTALVRLSCSECVHFAMCFHVFPFGLCICSSHMFCIYLSRVFYLVSGLCTSSAQLWPQPSQTQPSRGIDPGATRSHPQLLRFALFSLDPNSTIIRWKRSSTRRSAGSITAGKNSSKLKPKKLILSFR